MNTGVDTRDKDTPGTDRFQLLPADQRRLDRLLERLRADSQSFLGYPCNLEFDYSPLYGFLSYTLNNVGDPYCHTTFHLNTHDFECEVVEQFARLTHARPDETWGYVTNGGTEGNMYALYLARELFADGVVYYSRDTHYSVAKILHVLNMPNTKVPSLPNGEIDYARLAEAIGRRRDAPPIIVANIGTTMKGAVDNVERIGEILDSFGLQRRYIHADAALGGMILPFLPKPQAFDFAAGVDSIAISGHKMIGSPVPCGVVLAKRANVTRIARAIEYIGTLDTTLSGSRNAITPLFLWYAIKTRGRVGFERMIAGCLRMADYAIARFKDIGIRAWRNPDSITVVFPRPAPALVEQWQLAVQDDIAHIVTMPHVDERRIDGLMESLRRHAA